MAATGEDFLRFQLFTSTTVVPIALPPSNLRHSPPVLLFLNQSLFKSIKEAERDKEASCPGVIDLLR